MKVENFYSPCSRAEENWRFHNDPKMRADDWISGGRSVINNAVDNCDDIPNLIHDISQLSSEIKRHPELLIQHCEAAIAFLTVEAAVSNICPMCGEKLSERVIQGGNDVLEANGERFTHHEDSAYKHCNACGWVEHEND